MLKNKMFLGALLTLISAGSYAVVTAIVKMEATQVATPVVVFVQVAVSLLLMTSLLAFKGKTAIKETLKSQVMPLHLVRTFFSLAIGYGLFYSVRYIPIVDGALLVNMAPLLVPFIAFLFMKQSINHRLWVPIVIGFSGVALILNPNGQIFHWAAIIAFGSAIAMAASILLVRKAAQYDSTTTTSFYYFAFGTLISGLVSIPFWHAMPLSVWIAIMISGILFFIVQYTLAAALKHADATIVSSLYYSNIIFTGILSMLLWHTTISLIMMLGIALTIVGGVLVIMRQKKSVQNGVKNAETCA